MKSTRNRRIVNLSLIFATCTLVAIFSSSQTYLTYLVKGETVNFWDTLRKNLHFLFPWVAFTPFIVLLARRFKIDRLKWFRSLPTHLLMSALFSFFHSIIYHLVYRISCWVEGIESIYSVKFHITSLLQGNILLYWIILGISYSVDYYKKYRERELERSQLEANLAQAHLQVLKMQLHPHFLFNTLHAISALIHKDPDAADKMISRLGDLLRLTLDNSGSYEVPLKEELEFLRLYLEIEQVRLGDRLKIELDIDKETLDALVPSLILQPLVENSIRHGLAPRKEGGRIKISSFRSSEKLVIQVYDNGIGFKEDHESVIKKKLGLANAKERLKQLYGAEQKFDLRNIEEGGALAALEIPFHIINDAS